MTTNIANCASVHSGATDPARPTALRLHRNPLQDDLFIARMVSTVTAHSVLLEDRRSRTTRLLWLLLGGLCFIGGACLAVGLWILVGKEYGLIGLAISVFGLLVCALTGGHSAVRRRRRSRALAVAPELVSIRVLRSPPATANVSAASSSDHPPSYRELAPPSYWQVVHIAPNEPT